MFTESVRVGCSFLACHGESAKYQTCLIFHQPFQTLDPNYGSTHLSSSLPILPYHSQSCIITSSLVLSLPVLSYHFQSCLITSSLALSLPVLSYHYQSCLITSSLVLSLPVLPYHFQSCHITSSLVSITFSLVLS